MPTVVHFIDVGQGNMVLLECANGTRFVFDCNITGENESRVLPYIEKVIGRGSPVRAFICSHRDADHIRGIKKLHARFPLGAIWDSGHPGTTTDSPEYREYMDLRRRIGGIEKHKKTYEQYGRTRLRYLSAKDDRLDKNANAQGIVLKVEQTSGDQNRVLGSTILPGDSDAETWRYAIMKDYATAELNTGVLMASHHGSRTFFYDPADTQYYYEHHADAISPDITVVSVGPNAHDHPDGKALDLYKKHSSGSNKGNKIFRTDKKGTMMLTLKRDGGWSIAVDQ